MYAIRSVTSIQTKLWYLLKFVEQYMKLELHQIKCLGQFRIILITSIYSNLQYKLKVCIKKSGKKIEMISRLSVAFIYKFMSPERNTSSHNNSLFLYSSCITPKSFAIVLCMIHVLV